MPNARKAAPNAPLSRTSGGWQQPLVKLVRTKDTPFLHGHSVPMIAPEALNEILASAADISLLVSDEGRIVSVLVNPGHRSFGPLEHWVGQPIAAVLSSESLEKFSQRRAQMPGAERPVVAELNHRDGEAWEFPVRYTFHRVDAEGSILMLGRDLRPLAEMQQQLVQAQLALEQDYEAQREMDTRYRVLMDVVRDAVLVVSISNGRILDLNAAAGTLLGGTRPDLIGGAIAQEFEGRRRGELLDSLSSLAVDEAVAPLELTARRSQKVLMVSPTMFRAAGERLLVCRLEEPSAVALVRDQLGVQLSRLFHEGVDGIVFTDADGVIRAANEAFVNLIEATGGQAVRGRSLADFLARGTVDLKVLIDNASRAGRLRLYASRMQNDYGVQIPVEISATWLEERPHSSMVLVIRDASRAEAMRRPGVANSDENMRSVMELVGASTLRDIVAETTDVVEKMCIETAVELTRNNRVAAAEMLGLSRQSLYVKLRKYGLLSRDGE